MWRWIVAGECFKQKLIQKLEDMDVKSDFRKDK